MVQSRGGSARLAYVEETSFGMTPTGSQMRLLPFHEEELEVGHHPFFGVGDGPERVLTRAGQGYIDAGGRVGLELELDSLGTLLKHTLGTSTTTGAQPPFTHVIKGSSLLPQGLSIEKAFTDVGHFLLFKGCRIDRLSIGFTIKESPARDSVINPPKAELEVVAKGAEARTTSAASTIVEGQASRALSYHLLVEEGGLVLNDLLGAQLTVENHLQRDGFVLNSRERYSVREGLRQVSGSLVIGFENLNHYGKLTNNTTSSLKIKVLQAPAGGIASLELYLPRVVFAGKAPIPVVKEAGPLGVLLPFTALKDPLEGTDIKVTLINDLSSI